MLYLKLFQQTINKSLWPEVDRDLLTEDKLVLPIQIKGKLVTTVVTQKNYNEKELLNSLYQLDKIKGKLIDRKVVRIINVPNKIINIITD